MSRNNNSTDHSVFLVIVGLLSWIIPGAGHFVIKERKRAAVIFITITALFLTGLHVGSIGIIDPVGGRPWYAAQILVSPLVFIPAGITTKSKTSKDAQEIHKYDVFGHPESIGQIYTSIAGLLNLLCILSAVYMAHSGRGEMIGEEEDA
jgi:hypothetical protein